jgi:Zn-dependent protease with chaperone function
MKQEKFDALVKRLEIAAARSPAWFRVRTALWVLVGYLGIGLALILVLIAAGGMLLMAVYAEAESLFFLWLGLAVLVFGLYSVGRVVWSFGQPPDASPVTAAQAPALFSMLSDLAHQSDAPMFDDVQLTEEMNASVCEVPRFGIPFWRRRYLLIGLPLLSALTLEECRAVLAHEYGHLSPKHRRFSGMIYRLRRSWERIFQQMETMTSGLLMRGLLGYVRWFWPRFNAHAFVLSRTCEYEADGAAARHVNAQAISQALARFRAVNQVLEEEFWQPLWRSAATLPEPPADALLQMPAVIAGGLGSSLASKSFNEARRMQTTNTDTHPCLRDRLTRLGTWPEIEALHQPLPMPGETHTAAQSLLGQALPTLWNAVGQRWAREVKKTWQSRHARARLLRPVIESGHADTLPERRDEWWQYVQAVNEVEGPLAALPLLSRLLSHYPDHGAAQLEQARLLLKMDNPTGFDHLALALRADRSLYEAAAEITHDYYWRQGQEHEAKKVLRTVEDQAENQTAKGAHQSARSIQPYGLTGAELEALFSVLEREPLILSAHLGSVPAPDVHSLPMLYLCVQSRRKWWQIFGSADEEALVRRISAQVRLPGRTLVFAPTGRHRRLANRLLALEAARVWPRSLMQIASLH